MSNSAPQLPVAVLGAGPVGLAAAVHLLQRGLTPLVLEAGERVGANLASVAHVQLFSPWRYNIDKASSGLLEGTGWVHPSPAVLPTAGELVDVYLAPLAAHPALAPHIRINHRVTAVSKAGTDKVRTKERDTAPFVVRVSSPEGEREFAALAVIDATGTWNQPNPLGANGLPALGEVALVGRISYGMPDILGAARTRYSGKRVLVVGAGHSAAGNLLALADLARAEPATQIVWALRGDNWTRIFGGGAADGLPARGALGQRLKQLRASGSLQVHTSFRIHELRNENGSISVLGQEEGTSFRIDGVDEIIVATGSRPDLTFTRELRLKFDHWLESTEALAPLIDPNEHSCGTVRPHGHRELSHPERGYYAVGAKSYGRAPTFLLATGYEQVRSVVAAIAGDLIAADEVQLDLPQTGVCSVSFDTPTPEASVGCCGGPARESASACCVADEDAKAAGKAGCGCNSAKVPQVIVAAATSSAPLRQACCG